MARSYRSEECFMPEKDGIETFYLDQGPKDGPLVILVHGWPGIAQTWLHQLSCLASLGFRVVAPDMRGYGKSTATKDAKDYRLERLVRDLVILLAHLERDDAIWIGHDWGCGVVSALAAHHPEVCNATAYICVPYRTIELGFKQLVPLSNPTIYPREEYPFAQWEYMEYYERHAEKAVQQFDEAAEKTLKLLFAKGDPGSYNKPARTARVLQEQGWFGGMSNVPDIPLSMTVIDEHLHGALVESQQRNSFFGACAYYFNHAANQVYAQKEKNGGVLDMPVLFVGARYDGVCATTNSRLAEPMRRACRNLTECTVDGGHWVQMECPMEVNSSILRWIAAKVPLQWPFSCNVPLSTTQ